MNLKISQLSIGTLGTGDWLPIERDASINYRLNLHESITGAISDSYGTVRLGARTATGVGVSNTIAIGDDAGRRTEGSDNIFIGEDSGSGIVNGSFNVFIGDGAAANAVTASNNVVIGRNAGKSVDPGDNCVLIGGGAVTDADDDNSIVIGYNGVGAGPNTVVIGNDSITDTVLKGTVTAVNSKVTDFLYLGSNDRFMTFGEASPQGDVVAPKGSLYICEQGNFSGLYIKETGSDAYGWSSVLTNTGTDGNVYFGSSSATSRTHVNGQLVIGGANTIVTSTNNIVGGASNSLSGNGPYNMVMGTNNTLTLAGGYGHSVIFGTDNKMNTASTEYGWRGQNLIIGNLHEVVGECTATIGFHNRIDGRGTLSSTWATMTGGTMVDGAGGQCMVTIGAGAHAYWHGCLVIASHHNVDGQQSLGDVSVSSTSAGSTCASGASQTAQLKLSRQYDARLILKPNTLYTFDFQINAAFITVAEWGATWNYRVVVHQGATGTSPLLKEVTRLGRGRGSQNGEVPKGWSIDFGTTTNELTANITVFNPFGSAAAWTALASFRQTETSALYSAGGGPLLTSAMLSREDICDPQHLICRDDFLTKNVTSNTLGELGWTVNNTTPSALGSIANHPGIVRLTQNASSIGILSLQSATTPIAVWDNTQQEWVFRSNSSSTLIRIVVGLMQDVNTYATGGCRVLVYDQDLSANWRILHYTEAGSASYTDTGVAYVAGDWVHVKLVFTSGSTVATIRTTTYPTPVSVTNSSAYTITTVTAHTPAFMITNLSGGAITADLDFFGMVGPQSRI